MSLVQGYSSDEDAAGQSDAFNLAAIPSSKRFRVQDTPLNTNPHAAPYVLAQVGFFHSESRHLFLLTRTN